MLRPTIYLAPNSILKDKLIADLRNAVARTDDMPVPRSSAPVVAARLSRPSHAVVIEAAG